MKFAKSTRLTLGFVIGVFLIINPPIVRADYTNNMLAHWTFSDSSLSDGISGFVLKTNGAGSGQTFGFDASSDSVVLGPGMELMATNINSVAYPELKNGLTIWVRMQLTNNPDNFSYLVGLVNANNSIASAGDMSVGLFENTIVGSGYWGVSFKNSIVSQLSGTIAHEVNQFVSVAIVYTNTQALALYANGSLASGATYPGNIFPLQDFKGFAFGRLLNAVGNSGGNMFFQEARVYNKALSAAQIAQIGLTLVTAYPDTASTPWDTPVTVSPLVNDYEPNGLPLTVVSVNPTNAIASIVGGTNVLITPTLGTTGTAHIGYIITNGNGGSAKSVITVSLTTPLTPKTNVVANPDSVFTPWDTPVIVNPLINDYEPNGLPLTVVNVNPTNTTASIVGGTNVLINPTLGKAGVAYVGYTITNGNGGSAESVITVTLTSPPTNGGVAQADSFVDSIGVNVHMWFPGTPYVTSYGAVKTKLVASKIRHIRDGLAIDRGPVPAWKELATNGIKTGYIFTPEWAPTVSAYTNYLFTNNLLGTVDYFEGPNEYDVNAFSNPNWVSVLTNFQASLYFTLKGDPKTARFPVLSASFLINQISHRQAVGSLSAWCDYGNCHPYPGPNTPSDPQVTNEIGYSSVNTGSQPIYITETGYHNAMSSRISGNYPVSETAVALYLPRLYFDAFARGIVRTYWYEFVESQTDNGTLNNPEAHFGLVRYDLSEKPAYTALTNLIAIMSDPGGGFTSGSLNYSLSGATVKSVLFQKRDGSFYLALWREVSVWNVSTLTDTAVPSANVTVNLPAGVYNVQAYSPTISANAQQSWTGVSSVTVGLQGEVKILKITGGVLPPVANPNAATTTWNAPVMVSPLANDTDPNSFPLIVTSVSPTNGMASIIAGTNVLITPITGTTGTVTVGYSITNWNSGSANSIITVTVTAPPKPVVTSASIFGNLLVMSGTNGAADGVYQILSTTNLALPLTNWIPALTNTFGKDGGFIITNAIKQTDPAEFYLIKQ